MPAVQPAPVDPAIDPDKQAAADEASRRAKQRQQKGTSSSKTIITSGLGVLDDVEDDVSKKRSNLG